MAYNVNNRVLYRGCVHTIVHKTILYELDGIVLPVEADELEPAPLVWTDESVVAFLCEKLAIEPSLLLSRDKHAAVVQARQAICMHLRDNEKWTFKRIGTAIKRDHCTVLYHCRQFHDLLDVGDKMALAIVEKLNKK